MSHTIDIPWPLVFPFILLLLSIGLLPILTPHLWEDNRMKGLVGLIFSAPVLAFFILKGPFHPIWESLHEYVSFIALLGSLFVVSGGLVLHGELTPEPSKNTLILGIGAVLANLVGTTGASMLLIRPMLRANASRKNTYHIPIFFIFIVSNAGGLLTPLGDPPLFLGYLRGVPFTWTLKLLPIWLFVVGILLVIFYIWDKRAFMKENPEDLKPKETKRHPLKVVGLINIIFFAGILTGVFLHTPWREITMVAMAVVSMLATPKQLRKENSFNFHPIIEVAVLFIAIFITMTPALFLLKHHSQAIGITTPVQFFWLTGSLSSFLDNAPTYLTFFSLAQGMESAGTLVAGVPEHLLIGISAGAVLMGANSYIGNGPNFMIKAIASSRGFKTPGFFTYILYAAMILLPTFFIMTLIFLK